MARTIYDKPTRALLKDMLADWDLKPGQVFTTSRALEWFAANYPKLKPGSIRAHLVQASTNDRSRLHHPATNETDDLLFKLDSGQFRRYEPGKDPAPIHEMVQGDVARQEGFVMSRPLVVAEAVADVQPGPGVGGPGAADRPQAIAPVEVVGV